MMPICPEQKPFSQTPTPCKFHYEASITPALSYRAQQCRAREWEIFEPERDVHMTLDKRLSWMLPDSFYTQNNDQYVGPRSVTAGDPVNGITQCTWCECDQQIEKQDSVQQCGMFKETCCTPQGNLEWAEWGSCNVAHAHKHATCGLGKRERTRICHDAAGNEVTDVDAVDAICYTPNIRRLLPWDLAEQKMMKDNPEYYQSEQCYLPCPDDLVNQHPWGPCTACQGRDIRIRHGQETSSPDLSHKADDSSFIEILHT